MKAGRTTPAEKRNSVQQPTKDTKEDGLCAFFVFVVVQAFA